MDEAGWEAMGCVGGAEHTEIQEVYLITQPHQAGWLGSVTRFSTFHSRPLPTALTM